jgi:hypothetical protein
LPTTSRIFSAATQQSALTVRVLAGPKRFAIDSLMTITPGASALSAGVKTGPAPAIESPPDVAF